MNISEASAVNRLLRYLLRIPRGAVGVDVSADEALQSAVYLADRAHGTLGAGLHGSDVGPSFEARFCITAEKAEAISRALESGNYLACDGEEVAGLPDCQPCEGTGKRFDWDDLPDCEDCGGLGKVRAAEGAAEPAEPRSWSEGDWQPEDVTAVVDPEDVVWVYEDDGDGIGRNAWNRRKISRIDGGCWATLGPVGYDWHELLAEYGPVREATDQERQHLTVSVSVEVRS